MLLERGVFLRKSLYCAALGGVAALSSFVTIALRPAKVVVAVVAPVPAPRLAPVVFTHPLSKPKPEPVVRHVLVRKVVRHAAKPRVAVSQPHPRTTPSLYERTISPVVLREQGCRAGQARTSGLVILDFGKPAYRRGGYGTLTFANRFASNTAITWATKAYARGYVGCLPKFAKARIVLVRGTSNYGIDVPSAFQAGQLWAQETAAFARWLELHHFASRVVAAAGDDAEPAWDPHFRRTFDFFRGFRRIGSGHFLYNYGSLDGGPGQIWNVRQAYYVSAGMLYARAVPEIYNSEMAKQWATLSRIAADRYGKPVEFAGVMTQHSTKCHVGCYTPAQAHKALVQELAKSPKTRVRMLAAATNIAAPAPAKLQP